jgi:hypothetical protein
METNSPERLLELLEEAARRANWDAQHGPVHLRTGRFFISAVLDAHAFAEHGRLESESVGSSAEENGTDAA